MAGFITLQRNEGCKFWIIFLCNSFKRLADEFDSE